MLQSNKLNLKKKYCIPVFFKIARFFASRKMSTTAQNHFWWNVVWNKNNMVAFENACTSK